MIQNKHRGAHNELVATIWLLREGYDVFRNVSQHGLVDIVAMKDGELFKFDVKASRPEMKIVRLSKEQIDLGVKPLWVFPDGHCAIMPNPLPPFAPGFAGTCKGCQNPMIVRTPRQLFCTEQCCSDHHAARYADNRASMADSGATAR